MWSPHDGARDGSVAASVLAVWANQVVAEDLRLPGLGLLGRLLRRLLRRLLCRRLHRVLDGLLRPVDGLLDLRFTILPQMMMLVDEEGGSKLELGAFQVLVGGCSPGKRAIELGMPEPLTTGFTVF